MELDDDHNLYAQAESGLLLCSSCVILRKIPLPGNTVTWLFFPFLPSKTLGWQPGSSSLADLFADWSGSLFELNNHRRVGV
jgi:hypothetical protein